MGFNSGFKGLSGPSPLYWIQSQMIDKMSQTELAHVLFIDKV